MDLRAELESALAKLHAREHELEALKTHRAAEQHALLLAASSRLESRQSGTPPRELAPSTSFTADTDADSACPASSPTASASTFRRTSSALAPAPALRLRPCLLLSEAGAVKEEARRVLERLGVAPSVVCSLSEANLLAARPEPWPELELVLVDAGALGPAGARPSSVFGPGAGCGSLARLVKAQSVPVLWLTADPDADLDAALAAGCTGVAGLPLDADALQEVLFQQRDLQRLWLWRALLDSSALFPAPPAIARRAAALAQRADGVCQHALLAAVSLTLEFPAADRSRRSAHHALVSAATTASDASSAVHKLGQLLQQCAVAVHDVAEQRGALVTHAAGDAFTLVLLPPPSPSPRSSSPSHARASPTRRSPDAALDTATLAVAALELASALLRAFDTLPDMPDGKAPVARAGLAFGPGFEAVACGLPATSGKPVQTPSARRAQEAPTLAFFGAPLLGAAAMAGSADAGAVRMGGDVFRTLFPRAEASANEFSFSPASESWFALGPNAFVPAAALAPGALPNVAVHRLPAERGDAEKVGEEGGGERGFQAFAADMLRRGRARTLLRQMEDEPTGAARVARSDVALVAVAAAKVGRCAHTLFGGVPQGARRAESGGRGGGGGGGVATQSENPSDKNPPDGDRLLAKAHILSVDDSAVNQLVMESILRPLVRKLSSCMDGPDTLDVLEEGCDLPDIILLDVMMPSMSGLEVCRILRERYSPTQLPIVLVSGKSSKESIVEGLAAGANDYVTKPFDSAELLSRVKGQLMAAAMAKAEVQDAGTETIHRKMLPPAILRSWEARPAGEEVAEELEHASVLCAAIEGYSMLTSHASTREVVQALSALCLGFDELCEAGDAWRVQSAPDSYMVVAGQSQTDDDDHAARLATIGLDMIKVARSISHPVCPGSLKIRVAVHSGPVRNGVVAGSLPRYFVCGDTVDLTSRIVELTQPMTVTVSASSQRRLGQFQCLSLGRRRIGETCELETFVVKDKSSAWEAALECARRRSSIRSTTTTSSLLQDVPKYLASPLSASTTPATPVPKAPAHRPGKLQVVAVDDGFLDSGAASDVSHDDSSTLGASDLSASVERSVASPASQRRAGAPRTAPAARESRKRPQQPPAALEQQQQQQHQQHQQLAIEQQQQQQQQQQQPASMASSHNNNPHAWPASLRTAWPAVEARGCDVVAVTASSGYRWRTDPLLFVLERAKVPHLGPVLAKEGVEVDFLAHAEELELKALGLENISERARVQRFAKAWMLLHADTA